MAFLEWTRRYPEAPPPRSAYRTNPDSASRWALSSLAALVLWTGCTGEVTVPSSGQDPTALPPGTGGPGGPIPDEDTDNLACSDDGTIGLTVPNARRLTRFEYFRTLEDLFDIDTTDLQGQIPDEARSAGALNHEANLAPDREHAIGFRSVAKAAVGRIVDFPALVERHTGGCLTDSEDCYRAWVEGIGLRLFRRPVDEALASRAIELHRQIATQAGGDFLEGARGVLEGMLQAPQFLYLMDPPAQEGETFPADDYTLASRQ